MDFTNKTNNLVKSVKSVVALNHRRQRHSKALYFDAEVNLQSHVSDLILLLF